MFFITFIGVFYVLEFLSKLNSQEVSFVDFLFLFFAFVTLLKLLVLLLVFITKGDFNFFKKINKELNVDARYIYLHPLLIFLVIAICLFVYFRNLDNFMISLGQSFYTGIFIFDMIYLIGNKKESKLKPKPLYKHWISKVEAIEKKYQNRNNE